MTSCTNNAQTATTTGPWTVDPHKALVCLAEYVFDQDTYEAGPLDFVASATSTELPLGVSSAPARITPTYTPALTLYKGACTFPASARKFRPRTAAGECSAAASCMFLQQALAVAAVCVTAATILPAAHHGCCPFLRGSLFSAAGFIECEVAVANTGSARLKDVQLSGPYGPPCAAIATLPPAANITTCVVKLSVDQADFDAHELNPASVLSLSVKATGTSNVSTALFIPSPAATFTCTGLRLPIDRSMEVTASLSAGVVN